MVLALHDKSGPWPWPSGLGLVGHGLGLGLAGHVLGSITGDNALHTTRLVLFLGRDVRVDG